MMERLLARAEAAGRGAQGSRIERIATRLREAGVSVVASADSIVCSGRGLSRRWLADPLLRFAARAIR